MSRSSEAAPLLGGGRPARYPRIPAAWTWGPPPPPPPPYRDNGLGQNRNELGYEKYFARRSVKFAVLAFVLTGVLVAVFFAGRLSAFSAIVESRKELLNERRIFELDKQRWDEKRRKAEEADRAEKERVKRARLTWVDVTPESDCIAYGTRRYSAKLFNLPLDIDRLKWCEQTPINILGHEYPRPDFCTVHKGEYFGHWTANKGQLGCNTYFSFLDRETKCVPGVANRRRYVAKLENFQEKDWPRGEQLCSTTPIELHDMKFDHPDRCELWSGWVGVVGILEVPDESCPSKF